MAAGRPPHAKAPLGRFKEWDSLVRGALIWTADVEGFLVEVAKSPATRNRFTSLLSGFYKRAIAHGHAKDNPAAGVKRVREEERDVPALSLE